MATQIVLIDLADTSLKPTTSGLSGGRALINGIKATTLAVTSSRVYPNCATSTVKSRAALSSSACLDEVEVEESSENQWNGNEQPIRVAACYAEQQRAAME
ncbi:hypothetical protein BPOR_1044g00040 [Botrytis porri]|uniref:Uncharacterized protein n=1 Tax=Botrytis porri TaxID=87229 RepID=A0A4Z1KKJ5_9HELO|nr:hypothetical protein BPOR_1044g00040 [Botrytis porri]